jgi:hypothetical protein
MNTMRLKNSKIRSKEPEIIEISSDDDNSDTQSNKGHAKENNIGVTIGKPNQKADNKDSGGSGGEHPNFESNGNGMISNSDIAIINFEPWNVLGSDVENFDFQILEQHLPNNDFVFNLPCDFVRFGTLEYKTGNVDFITNKGISIVSKGEQRLQPLNIHLHPI